MSLDLNKSFSIERFGTFSRLGPEIVRWSTPAGESLNIGFSGDSAFLHYVADPDRGLAVLASEYSDEIYALNPISRPWVRLATQIRRFQTDRGMRYLKLVGLDGDVLVQYEQGMLRIGLNGEVRWIADPLPYGCSLDAIQVDVARLTCPHDQSDSRVLAIDLNTGRIQQ